MSAIPYHSFQQDFRIDKLIDKGNCAYVNQVFHIPQKKYYAHKVITSSSDQEINQALNQVQALVCLNDTSITLLHFYYFRHNKRVGQFQLGLIMDLCQSNLSKLIISQKSKQTFFKIAEITQFLQCTVPVLAKMQKRGLLHRDIKPDNILVTGNKGNDFKLADFGYAIQMNFYSDRNIAGTKEYVSPKLLVKFKNNKVSVQGHNIKDDVYSFGKTLYEMMTLEISHSISFKKWEDLRQRYGKAIVQLLDSMVRENEDKRADFITIQQQLNKMCSRQPLVKVQMDSSERNSKRRDQLSCSLNKSDASTVNLKIKSPKAGRPRNDSRTKRKNTASSVQTTLALKVEHQKKNKCFKQVQHSKDEDRWGENKMSKEQVKARFQISCLEYSQKMLFLGLEGQLGVMMLPSKKHIRFPHHDDFKEITRLKINKDQLFIATLNCKLYIVPIDQIKKHILSSKSFHLNNVLEINFGYLDCKEISFDSSLSTLCTVSDSSQCSVIVGHHTGQISLVNGKKVSKKLTFFNAPVTDIKLVQSTLYVATAEGHFKRQPSYYIGIEQNKEQKASKFDSNLSLFKCPNAIICFEIISSCRVNQSIQVEGHQHLAALACTDGFIYILSREMGCEQKFRVSHQNMLAGIIQLNEEYEEGYQALFVGRQGTLTNQKGKVLRQVGQKDLCCMVKTNSGLVCGGFNKKVIFLNWTIEVD